ncbi:MAG: hypothetical protein KF809_17435 [Chloroflexi bacterium]|nr:hypothetical protein [Chloroflexota bacterium]
MTVLTTGKRATHRPQRNTGSGTEGSDCNVRLTGASIEHASRGKVTWPSAKAEVKWIRDVMGKPKGATTIGDAIRVLRSPQLAARFAAQGLQPPPVRDRRGAQWGETIKDDLRDGALVGLAIDRGAWLDAGLPPDASAFRGGHAVGMFGMSSSSPWETQVMDPLLAGWRVLNYPALRKPAGLFGAKPWGEGRAEAYAVGRSKPLAVTPPEPPTPDPALDRAIASLLASAQESDDTAAALESQATTLRTRATARRALVETLRGG